MSKELELLEDLRTEIDALEFKAEDKLDTCRRRTEMLTRRIFGDNSNYLKELADIRFSPVVWFSGMTEEDERPAWNSGKFELQNLIKTMIEDLTLFGGVITEGEQVVLDRTDQLIQQSIFVVHGYDEAMKQSIAQTLEKLGLKPLILHEQPNNGRAVIEKLMDYREKSSFAVILLSPDDLAYKVGEDPATARYRTKQNVVFELGFFLGKLGKNRVVVIHKEADKFETPLNFSDVLFVPFDNRDNWKFELVRELKAAGYKADANALT